MMTKKISGHSTVAGAGASQTLTRLFMIKFFFSSRRRHTRFDCDWSSDVCSSDLLSGAARPVADGSEFELHPGTMVRVGPDQLRQILPGPDGIRFVAIGGSPGVFTPGAWTELGADPPEPPAE